MLAKYGKGITYHEMNVAMAVDLICNVERAASALSDRQLALLLGLEVPHNMVVLWVLDQLCRRQRAVSSSHRSKRTARQILSS